MAESSVHPNPLSLDAQARSRTSTMLVSGNLLDEITAKPGEEDIWTKIGVRRDILPDEELSPLFEGIMKIVRDRSSIVQTTLGATLLPDFWSEDVDSGTSHDSIDSEVENNINVARADQSAESIEEKTSVIGDFSESVTTVKYDIQGEENENESSGTIPEGSASVTLAAEEEVQPEDSSPNPKTLIIISAGRRDQAHLISAVMKCTDEYEKQGLFDNERTVVLTQLMDEPDSFKEGDIWGGTTEVPADQTRMKIRIEPGCEGYKEDDMALAMSIKEEFYRQLSNTARQSAGKGPKTVKEIVQEVHSRAMSTFWGQGTTEDTSRQSSETSAKTEAESKGKDVAKPSEETDLDLTLQRHSNQLKGRPFTADLERLSTPELEKLCDGLHDEESADFSIPHKDFFALHKEVDFVMFERRSKLSGDDLVQDSYLLTRKYQDFLKKDTGIDTALKAIENHMELLKGHSRDMLVCRLLFTKVLSRAYEMRGTKEYRKKNVEFLRKSLEEHDELQTLNICIDGEDSHGSAVMYSETAELYARALQFPILYDIENREEQHSAAQEAIKFLAEWAERDIEEGLRGKAAWKLVMEAGFRLRHLVASDIDTIETIGPLLDRAELYSISLDARDKAQFDQELKERREAYSVLLAVKAEVYSEDESASSPPDMFGSLDRAAIRDVWPLVRKILKVETDSKSHKLQADEPRLALTHLLLKEIGLDSLMKLREVNPLHTLNEISRCHLELCELFLTNISVFNLRFIHVRPNGWILFCIEEFVKHFQQVFRLKNEVRKKISLTTGLSSLLDQIDILTLNDTTKDMRPQEAFGFTLLFWQYLWIAGDQCKRAYELCWRAWHASQEYKAQSFADVLATNQYVSEGLLRDSPFNDAATSALFKRERYLVQNMDKYQPRIQLGMLHELGKLRENLGKSQSLDWYADMQGGATLTPEAAQRMFGKDPEFANTVLVDWLPVRNTFSVSIVRSSPYAVPRIFPVQVDIAAVKDWLSTYSTTDDLSEPEALEDLQHALSGLVEPLAEHTKEGDTLVLCPTGILHSIPLHALLVDGRLLIERNPVLYCHNQTILDHAIKRFRVVASAAFQATVFGDPTGDTTMGTVSADALNHELSKAQYRLSSVDGVGDKLQTTALYGQSINKLSFRKRCEDSTIIHYHGHASYDSSQILDNGLLLQDGVLTAREIFPFHLSYAPLVTLIACGSGRQAIQVADEPLGIVPAFLCAGAGSVIATQWPIADRDGAKFSEHFYETLLSDECRYSTNGVTVGNVARALQTTILKLRQVPGYKNSLYRWGAFFLSGAPMVKVPEVVKEQVPSNDSNDKTSRSIDANDCNDKLPSSGNLFDGPVDLAILGLFGEPPLDYGTIVEDEGQAHEVRKNVSVAEVIEGLKARDD